MPESPLFLPILGAALAAALGIPTTFMWMMAKGLVVPASEQRSKLELKDQLISDKDQRIKSLERQLELKDKALSTEAKRGDVLASHQQKLLEANEVATRLLESINAFLHSNGGH